MRVKRRLGPFCINIPASNHDRGRLRKHVRILGWLHIILGIIDLLIGLMAFGMMSGIGALTGDITAFGVLSAIGGFAGIIMLVVALPNFLCGLGLLNNWGGWVILVAVFLGIINLAQFPIGTALALYTFWIAWKLYHGAERTQ
jgi:hypothetical protein